MKEYKKKIDDAVEQVGEKFRKKKEREHEQDERPSLKKIKKAVESGKDEA
jgi:hypothetical protein